MKDHRFVMRYISSSVLLASVVALSGAEAQVTSTQPSTSDKQDATLAASDVDLRVASILDRILKRGEGTAKSSVGDVKYSRWVPPEPTDVEEIRQIGVDAIAPLDRALEVHRPFQGFLVVRLLGEIGGPNVVPSLRRVVEESNRGYLVRVAALAALLNCPRELAVPIIQRSTHDPDPMLAERAKDFLKQTELGTAPN